MGVSQLEVLGEEIDNLRHAWAMWRRFFDREEEPGVSTEKQIEEGDRSYRITSRAPLVFSHLRWHLLRGILVDLCRICDPPATGGHQNLTLSRFANESSYPDNPGWKPFVQKTADMAAQTLKQQRIPELRNKVLAHLDLGAATGSWEWPDLDIDRVATVLRMVITFHHRAANPGSSYPSGDVITSGAMKEQVDNVLDALERGGL